MRYCFVKPGSPVALTVIVPELFVLLQDPFGVVLRLTITGLLYTVIVADAVPTQPCGDVTVTTYVVVTTGDTVIIPVGIP